MICKYHLCDNQLEDRRWNRQFCSPSCKNKYFVIKRRHKLKELAVEYKGGCCSQCFYARDITALEFHHLDPNEKDFSISRNGSTRSWEGVQKELDKCILVCANCHREIHSGFSVPRI